MKLSLEVKSLTERIERLKTANATIRQRWAATLFRFGQEAVTLIKRDYRGAKKTTPIATAVRTGRLRASYAAQVTQGRGFTDLVMGPLNAGADVLKYERIHEFGGTITAKSAKMLASPLAAAKTAAGVARGGPRDFSGTFIARSKAGNLLIFGRASRGETPTPLFVLKHSVTIPARPALMPSFERVFPGLRDALTEDAQQVLAA